MGQGARRKRKAGHTEGVREKGQGCPSGRATLSQDPKVVKEGPRKCRGCFTGRGDTRVRVCTCEGPGTGMRVCVLDPESLLNLPQAQPAAPHTHSGMATPAGM